MANKKERESGLDTLDDAFYAGACDLNGIWRGKRLPPEQYKKVQKGQMRMPLSALALDIWGADIADSPLVFETGDRDGLCEPTERGMVSTQTGLGETHLLPLMMRTEEDEPSPADPRQILQQAVLRAQKSGWSPVMALEMEFYLFDPSRSKPDAPHSPLTGIPLEGSSILSLDELDEFKAFMDDVYRNAKAQGIAVDTAICEAGRGQFEFNLLHGDPMRAADDAVLFKRALKAVAQSHNLTASFMAKPDLNEAGSGMHVHFSMLNEAGENIFNDGGEEGTQALKHAVGGLLGSMSECTLIWAPHLNSYRRFQPGSHAPTRICWGYENRTTAIRIPGGAPEARRIEHRIAGADANPYLVLAAILHGALDGIEGKISPPSPVLGDAYAHDMDQQIDQLPRHWLDSIRGFEQSEFITKNFPGLFQEVFSKIKRQEYEAFNNPISTREIHAYLRSL